MAESQRPLSLGEILDRTVQLYRRNFLSFAGISAIPAGVTAAVFGGAGVFLGSRLAALKPATTTTAPNLAASNPDMALIFLVLGVVVLVGLPLMLLVYTLNLSASNYASFRAYEGEKITIRDAYGYAFKHFWRHLGLLCLQALFAGVIPYAVFAGIVVVGAIIAALVTKAGGDTAALVTGILVFLLVLLAITLVVVVILIWLRYSLAFSASVVEEQRAWPSMKRSAKLSKGTRGRIFVMFLLIYCLSVAVTMALLIPMFVLAAVMSAKELAGPQPPTGFFILLQAANLGISFLVRALVTPIYSTALLLFYFDQRTRQEGWDIEQLMAQAGWGSLPAPMPPPLPPPLPPVLPPTQPFVEPIAESATGPTYEPTAGPISEPYAEPHSDRSTEETGS